MSFLVLFLQSFFNPNSQSCQSINVAFCLFFCNEFVPNQSKPLERLTVKSSKTYWANFYTLMMPNHCAVCSCSCEVQFVFFLFSQHKFGCYEVHLHKPSCCNWIGKMLSVITTRAAEYLDFGLNFLSYYIQSHFLAKKRISIMFLHFSLLKI